MSEASRIYDAARTSAGRLDIWCAAKAGDLASVRFFVEVAGVEVNTRFFDATALFYASLAGHIKVVQYLLDKGACCATGTFDGDRALYGALNDEVRQLLLRYAARPTPLSEFAQNLSALLDSGEYSDVKFVVGCEANGENVLEIRAHRVILQARVARFRTLFDSQWRGKKIIVLSRPELPRDAFAAIVAYCYTDVLEFDARATDDVLRICRALELRTLHHKIRLERTLMGARSTLCPHTAKRGRGSPAAKRLCLISPCGSRRLSEDLEPVLQSCLPVPRPEEVRGFRAEADVCVQTLTTEGVDGGFFCHRAILTARSGYWRTMLSSAFAEGRGREARAPCTAAVFSSVLRFVYTDDDLCAGVEAPAAFMELVYIANLYMLPVLKSRAARRITALGLLGADAEHPAAEGALVGEHEEPPPTLCEWLCFGHLHDAIELVDACADKLGEEIAAALSTTAADLARLGAEACAYALGGHSKSCAEFAVLVKQPGGSLDRETALYLCGEVREGLVEHLRTLGIVAQRRDRLVTIYESAVRAWLGEELDEGLGVAVR